MGVILICPQCDDVLAVSDEGAVCQACSIHYPRSDRGVLDLRLQTPKTVQQSFTVGTNPLPDTTINFELLQKKAQPQVDFTGVKRPYNISDEDLSYFPKATRPDARALDLGCGAAHFRTVIEHAGFEYAGLDLKHKNAPILGDTQALPFPDQHFSFIWSHAMLQYVPYGYVAIQEIHRVLEPGGLFMGTVGFMEGWDGNSYHMYTQNGILNLLHYGGFDIQILAPDDWWTGLTAIGSVALFPRVPLQAIRVLMMPLDALSKLWWWLARQRNPAWAESRRVARFTGGYTFIAHKPTES